MCDNGGKIMNWFIFTSFFVVLLFSFLFIWLYFQYQNNVMRQQIQEIRKMNNETKQKPYNDILTYNAIDVHKDTSRKLFLRPIATQPSDTEFRQVGFLYAEDNYDKSESKHILPLFGRHLNNRSDRWNYYTMTNGYREIKMPITNANKNCLNEYGCEELQTNDIISLPQYKNNFKVSLYEKNGPIYNPNYSISK